MIAVGVKNRETARCCLATAMRDYRARIPGIIARSIRARDTQRRRERTMERATGTGQEKSFTWTEIEQAFTGPTPIGAKSTLAALRDRLLNREAADGPTEEIAEATDLHQPTEVPGE